MANASLVSAVSLVVVRMQAPYPMVYTCIATQCTMYVSYAALDTELMAVASVILNPLPAPGIIVGAVHGRRAALGRPPGSALVDGYPGPPKC